MQLKIFSVMQYQPKIRKKTITNRPSCAFLYLAQGEYVYHSKECGFTLKKGDAVFYKKHSSYEYEFVAENNECWQIELELESENDEFEIGNKPVILNEESSKEFAKYFPAIMTYFRSGKQGFFKTSAIAMYFLSLVNKESEGKKSKIKPAIDYIEQNYTLDFSAEFLAQLCKISESQLRRLFQAELGVSPLKFRNSLRIREACALLRRGEMSVSEVSEVLTFDTPYAFSKAFKNEKGISPKSYQMKNK